MVFFRTGIEICEFGSGSETRLCRKGIGGLGSGERDVRFRVCRMHIQIYGLGLRA